MGHGLSRLRLGVACAGLVVTGTTLIGVLAVPAGADLPPATATLLGSNARTGYAAGETQITAGTAPDLALAWTDTGATWTTNQPVSADGLVFWSDGAGTLHATSTGTGVDAWTDPLGTESASCSPLTFPDSSATVASLDGKPTVFIGGGTSQFEAIDAATGVVDWTTQLSTDPAAFVWSSPALYQGKIYVGLASQADCPQVRGALFVLDETTGAIDQTFYTVPQGCVGGTVWSSPTIDEATGTLYLTTGNAETTDDVAYGADPSCLGQQNEPLAQAIVALDLNTPQLTVLGSWQPPDNGGDADFGATPTLFDATINGNDTPLVGAVNKNGTYYALERTDLGAGPVWTFAVGDPSNPGFGNADYVVSSSFDGTSLYVAGDVGLVGGQSCAGTLSALDPATGVPRWSNCLAGRVLGSVVSAPGIVVAGAGDQILVDDSATGANLFTYTEPSQNLFWGPAEISDGTLYVGNLDGNLLAFRPQPAVDAPESPLAVLLPSASAAIFAGTIALRRRRRDATL
jgi:polyvinyl alcohol dehydrogenase (cytochrome)